MNNLFIRKKTKLYNGQIVKEGDRVKYITSDGVLNIGVIKRRKVYCTHQETGKKLKKGTLYFLNNGFNLTDYINLELDFL